jgi:hypothetical protein
MHKDTIKIFRWASLVLLLLGSLSLLFSANLGSPERMILGRLTWQGSEGQTAVTILTDSHQNSLEDKIMIPSSFILRNQLNRFPHDQEFLVVLNRIGGRVLFQRILPLEYPPENIPGIHWDTAPQLNVVVGTKPKLVELVGLSVRNFQVTQPVWYREHFAFTNRVGWEQGRHESLLEMLAGESQEFVPNVWLVDTQNRVFNVRRTGPSLLTWPVFLKRTGFLLYLLALLPAGLAMIFKRWPGLLENLICLVNKLPWRKENPSQESA